MKTLIASLLLLGTGVAQHATAASIVHIAAGDCAALASAASAAAGSEPALIVLARNASYPACEISVQGNIVIDGAGATMPMVEYQSSSTNQHQITVAAGARLTLRNINFDSGAAFAAAAAGKQPKFLVAYQPVISNAGTLLLDGVSVANAALGNNLAKVGGGLMANTGKVIVRNSSFAQVIVNGGALFFGDVELTHTTIDDDFAYGPVFGSGTFRIGNNAIRNTDPNNPSTPVCANYSGAPAVYTSLGGNVTSDDSCAFRTANDRVADARFLDFGAHGGTSKTVALNYDSPAIGNGVAANCEATDARGLARGANACDSGAYEIGGGDGKLSATGMSGLFFNAANNGHYVTIQRLYGTQALVIWNTFDENGVPAWLYGVGQIDGNRIHVDQVAQNVGGTLHAGGAVSGAKPTLWGTYDVDLSDCYNATLTYSSPLPQFGSGSTTLQRLAFLDGVNCAR